MAPSPESSGSSSSKRGAESSPCHELPSPQAVKRRKVELYQEFAAKDPDLLRSRCEDIEKKLDEISFQADSGDAALRDAVTALESANKALQDAQRLQSTAIKAVETATRTRFDVSSEVNEMSNRLANLRRIHSLQAVMAKRDCNKKAVEERESAIEKLRGDLRTAEYELQQSEMAADEEVDELEIWNLEFINEDKVWSSI